MDSSRAITLVITESLDKVDADAIKASGMQTTDWSDVHALRLSDYEIVIIDTRIGAQRRQSGDYGGVFSGMRSEIETLLGAGGAVFVLAGPSVGVQYEAAARRIQAVESNYDFLPSAVLVATKLSSSESSGV